MKGFFRRLREIWIIAGITLLIFLFIELFFRIFFLFSSDPDPRIHADCYKNADWVADYYKEFNNCNASTWESYVYWRRIHFEGQFINVTKDQLRKTVFQHNPSSDYDPLITIYMFGGSAMWGTGVRDEYTLPSLLGKELTKKGYRVEIINYGESGYVSSQELIELQLQLRAGYIPDLVIFYDGANDMFSSLQQNKAGLPQNENNREKEFNTLSEKKKSFLVFFESLKTLATMKFIRQKFISEPDHEALLSEYNLNQLAEETIRVYNENLRLVFSLAEGYNFHSVFYWQPLIFFKDSKSAYEKSELEKADWSKPFIQLSRDNLSGSEIHLENLDFYDLSNFFVTESEPIFIDWCHVGEYGNTRLAKRIAKDVSPICDSLIIQRERDYPQ
ncbi:MAG: SGNH/GDSL hydrolase family protein [Bacteroidetes bacterium]|nr:SGNH/GDSL hydrolase family protein [Bacteroidota bacterium]